MKRIGILTGGGDVPGLNSVIKTVASRCHRDGIELLGIRKGWQGVVDVDPSDPASLAALTLPLTKDAVRTVDRTGGTFLHSSRVNPWSVRSDRLPERLRHLAAADPKQTVDLTAQVQENLALLGVDALVVTGGDDTLGYAARLSAAGMPVVGVPKTMDNDVPGTEYCLGFSTALTRSVEMIRNLRTPTGSHERIAVIELFGRNCGATALFAGYLAAADRVLITEVDFDVERVSSLLAEDQDRSPSHYAICLVSEGAKAAGADIIQRGEPDPYGHRKLGGIGLWLGHEIEARTGRPILGQSLAYLMRGGSPDTLDSMVALNFGNLAYEILRDGGGGKMTALRNGCYSTVDLSVVIEAKRPWDVSKFYDAAEYRPRMENPLGMPFFLGEL